MRDERYKAVHKGGPLSLEHHRLLAAWAATCAEHVIYLFTERYPEDDRLLNAIEIARAWSLGDTSVGAARSAALEAHAAAREVAGAAQYTARAAGHAVATAHMADHAPRAAMFALKAVRAAADKQNEHEAAIQERTWQTENLPEEVEELVLSTFEQKRSSLDLQST